MADLPKREISGQEIALMQAEVVHDLLARKFKPYSFGISPVTEDKECYVVSSFWPRTSEENIRVMIEKTGREKEALFLLTSRVRVNARNNFHEFCANIEKKADEHILRFKNRQQRVA